MRKGKLWRYLRGYGQIQIEGVSLEACLRKLFERGIVLEQVERRAYTRLTAWAPLARLGEIEELLADTPWRCKVLRRGGFPMRLKALLHRKGLLVGLALAAGLAVYLMQFVWQVEVSGCEEPIRTQLEQQLAQWEIGPGTPRSGVDLDALEGQIASAFPELSFVHARMVGLRLYITTAPRQMPPEMIDTAQVADVVASCDGIIDTIDVYEGKALVKPGDKVVKGQVLISAEVTGKEDQLIRVCHARGKVTARIWRQTQGTAPTLRTEHVPAGDTIHVQSLQVGTWRIPLSAQPELSGQMDYACRKSALLGRMFLPIEWIHETYTPVNLEQQPQDELYIRQMAAEGAWQRMRAQLTGENQVDDYYLLYTQREDTLVATLQVETLEAIGQEVLRAPENIPEITPSPTPAGG